MTMDRTELVKLIDQVLNNSDGSPGIAGRIADCVMHKYILIHQGFNSLNPSGIAAFRAMDAHHAKVADIKLIPASPDDIQFKFPDIRPMPETPTGTMFMIPERRPGETEEEWGARCVKLTGIRDSKEMSTKTERDAEPNANGEYFDRHNAEVKESLSTALNPFSERKKEELK